MADFHFVTERLAVGGFIGTSEQMREISAAGITHIVDLQAEFDDHTIVGDTGVDILWNACLDDFCPKPSELFWRGVLFTLEALHDPDAHVLFHCSAGIHRGPMMLLAVMRVLGHESEHARAMIAAARPQVDFPEVYLESIEEFVREYHAVRGSRKAPAPAASLTASRPAKDFANPDD